MHYNPLAYIKNEADILKFVNTLIANTKGEGKEGDPFWTKSETLLYCALIAAHDLPELGNVKGGQPRPAANQYRAGSLAAG